MGPARDRQQVCAGRHLTRLELETMKQLRCRQLTSLLIAMGAILAGSIDLHAQSYVRKSGPELFSYDELVQLSHNEELSPKLAEKLHKITTTPFINNEAYLKGSRPRSLTVPGLGPTLRIAFWNIERGLELHDIQLLLTDKKAFQARVESERKAATEANKTVRTVDLEKLPEEIEEVKAADVWMLNEVDWGVKRTEYREVVRELAKTLGMNWAYGVEFLEIDPKQLGTATFDDVKDEEERRQLEELFKVDKNKLRALHGSAVLSRYPIRSARLVPFTVGYDWFKESKIRTLEKAKRKAGGLIGEDLLIEMRRGQRTTLYVDLDIPEAPGKNLTVACTHLENRAKPKVRRQQLQELLKEIHGIGHRVVVAGDMNTSGSDSTPTSAEYLLYKQFGSLDFWTTKGIQWTTGVGLIYTGTKTLWKLSGIQYRVDPTAANIPGISPNLEHGFFTTLAKYRFADGKAFDFRGAQDRTVNGTAGTLADSNQRQSAGFTPTFVTEFIYRKFQVAKFKLDWFFVKADLDKPDQENAPFLFAPHFPRVLVNLNNCLPERISDHSPMTIDLPFHEPTLGH
jgi:endonuclease/exonuclease/phosphatase family metal-dependent hydrolase